MFSGSAERARTDVKGVSRAMVRECCHDDTSAVAHNAPCGETHSKRSVVKVSHTAVDILAKWPIGRSTNGTFAKRDRPAST